MRRIWAVLLAGALLLGTGCSAGEDTPSDRAGLAVYVSIYPLYDFAAQIAGDKATVTVIIPTGGEAHDWEPTPSDIAALEQGDVFVYNGAGLEHWADTVLDALENDRLIVVEASRGISVIEDGQAGDESLDPHVWLSPVNAKHQAEAILNALVLADPDNSAYYRERYETLAQELEALDQAFREALEPYQGRAIVVDHQAFGYLCREYGLEQIAVQGLSSEGEPDAARMAQVIALAREENVKVIFFEEASNPGVAEAIAQELGVGTDVLNPLEELSREQLEAGEDYGSIMLQNLEALLRAFMADA